MESGEEHLRHEEWADAEEAFRRAVAADETSPVAWSKLGVALAQQRRFEEAAEALQRAINLNPRYAPAYSNLGNIYRQQERKEEALQAYRRAVDIDPDYWVARQNLGALYKEMGRLAEAVAEFRKATRLSVRRPSGDRNSEARRGCLLTSGGAVFLVGIALAGAVRMVQRGL